MAKLRRLSAREVIAILTAHGFVEARQRGSHIALQATDEDDKTPTVIVPNHKEIRTGTLRSIIRQSQLPRELFESE
ncbi:MAG: hypothetical protein CMJ78_10930 [Planctomycetaceae bacterium]|nr:hypothetical protein [Planctomycetaceae bacterium]